MATPIAEKPRPWGMEIGCLRCGALLAVRVDFQTQETAGPTGIFNAQTDHGFGFKSPCSNGPAILPTDYHVTALFPLPTPQSLTK